ncbi:hypothetical protein C6401_13655 [Arthrobacter woluwensis]|uniref:hypothetical protein n=1 Tax=Arthrobacter woluwensis TaxID=156980 RepID=UPI000D12B5A9|nr:hypothetical protein [Arthrobacter woluwensis]PSS43251.1 hypothetical protein C6401_13655 [Arthrobacter woluwensis]
MRSRSLPALVLAAALAVPLAACSAPASSVPSEAPTATTEDSAQAVVRSLGAVPVPSAPSAEPTASANASHGAVLAIGAPVAATLPDGSSVILTALGPDTAPVPVPTSHPTAAPDIPIEGTITVRVKATSGSVAIGAGDLDCRDQRGRTVALNPVGPATVTVAAGSQADLVVRGTFHDGAAQVTLRHAGHALALWTFNIEND